MKKFFKTSLLALLALTMFSACTKENETKLADLQVTIDMPEGFTATFNGEATIFCKALNKSYKATVAEGTTTFESILPGVYDLQLSKKMTKEEAQKAAPEVKISDDILINATKNEIVVAPEGENKTDVKTTWSLQSKLVISKIYCNGTRYNAGKTDNGPTKFYEIFNNSDEVQYLDGLCLASAHGLSTGNNECTLYTKYQKEATFASRIVRLPGNHGTDKNIALEPGKSFVITWNARNFIKDKNSSEEAKDKMTMSVDATGADYEIDGSEYKVGVTFVDNLDVPNMPYVFDAANFGMGMYELTQSMYIFFATEEEVGKWNVEDDAHYQTGKMKAKRVPNEIIIDAVETFKKDAKQHKRIADVLDATGVESKVCEGEIFIRKIQTYENGRMILMDTNSSKNDFVAVTSKDRENFDGSHLKLRDYSHAEIQPGI